MEDVKSWKKWGNREKVTKLSKNWGGKFVFSEKSVRVFDLKEEVQEWTA